MILYQKHCKIDSNAQNILFNDDGFIVDSDEQIFDTSFLQGDSLINYFPFIDSISSILYELNPGEPPIFFSGVETTCTELQGIYDYSFSRQIKDGALVTLWQVIDKTDDYTQKRNVQQARQDKMIRKHDRYSF